MHRRMIALAAGLAVGFGAASPALAREALVASGNATRVTSTSADLNGVIFSLGPGSWCFEISPDALFRSQVRTTPAVVAHGRLIVVERRVDGLRAGAAYFWRVELIPSREKLRGRGPSRGGARVAVTLVGATRRLQTEPAGWGSTVPTTSSSTTTSTSTTSGTGTGPGSSGGGSTSTLTTSGTGTGPGSSGGGSTSTLTTSGTGTGPGSSGGGSTSTASGGGSGTAASGGAPAGPDPNGSPVP